MPRFMLDTDICSYIMRRSNEALLRRLKRVQVEDICISVVTKSQLLYGVEVSPRRQQDEAAVEAFLRYVDVLDFPNEAAVHYAKIRAHLKSLGQMIGGNDLLIAAHARCLKLTLITNNIGEFSRVAGLSIENWMA